MLSPTNGLSKTQGVLSSIGKGLTSAEVLPHSLAKVRRVVDMRTVFRRGEYNQ
jgi:hypothetical protein